MNNWKLKLAKWLLKTDRWSFVAVKQSGGAVWIEGDTDFIRLIDIHTLLNKAGVGQNKSQSEK